MDPQINDILELWFDDWTESEPLPESSAHMKRWWGKNPELDASLAERFGHTLRQARAGGRDPWASTDRGLIALILLLDQFSRNIHRDTPDAFAADAKARELVHRAIDAGRDAKLPLIHRYFLYMPLMHSEHLPDHDRALERFTALIADAQAAGSKRVHCYTSALDYERQHRAIVERFGRYPHRNPVVGRENTAEEASFDQSF